MALELWLWRHPRPLGVAGRCIGRCDVPVDRRRAKRLAHQLRRVARQQGLPRVVWTSALQRCANVGRQLARWGWQHHVDQRLLELDFGRWDGQPWARIAHAEVAAWEADFALHAPGGGEPLAALLARCRAFVNDQAATGATAVLVVAHAGWINACARTCACTFACTCACADASTLRAHTWPAAPAYASLRRIVTA